MIFRQLPALAALAVLAACGGEGAPTGPAEGRFAGISATESVHYAGTEPFWSGVAGDGIATYATPENPAGREFAVERFAGNNGLGFSGSIEGVSFDLMITPGTCSDGMSDRTYPYTATLMLGGEQRQGCAWTDSQPFTGPEAP